MAWGGVVHSDETVDVLERFGLSIIQKRRGYRFSVDPLLLADFVRIGEADRIADLGTGCGIIPLALSRRFPASGSVGIELQQEMAEMAARNVALNCLEGKVRIVSADIGNVQELFPAASFDAVTANPPFRIAGSGRTSPIPGRDAARHETTAGLADFLRAAKHLVKTGGRIFLVYHVSRLSDLMLEARGLKLAPLRLQFVYPADGGEAKMFLAELVKGRKGELRVLEPLLVQHGSSRAVATGPAGDTVNG